MAAPPSIAVNAALDVKAIALTPVWTGNAERQPLHLLETGLLGGLRWWMEALARGVGATVPDPVISHSIYGPTSDPVSLVFGATGWRRRFRLLVDGGVPKSIPSVVTITETCAPDAPHTSRWYYGKSRELGISVPAGEIKLRILPTQGFDPMCIGGLLQFIADWGALGAKAQLGLAARG